jgi:hypothetical protein
LGRDAKARSDSRKNSKRKDGIQRNCCPIEVKRDLNLKEGKRSGRGEREEKREEMGKGKTEEKQEKEGNRV